MAPLNGDWALIISLRRKEFEEPAHLVAKNLKRLINIIGKYGLVEFLWELVLAVVTTTGLTQIIELKTAPLFVKKKKALSSIITNHTVKRWIKTAIT